MDESIPTPGHKRLYYYTGKQWGIKSLWEKRLKIARYQDLNDPFELIPFDRTNKRSRQFYDKKVKALLESNYGVLCFSESWRTTLMWSHYGEKHTGICLGFDIPEEFAEPINYIESLLDDPVDHKKHLRGMNAKVFEAALSSKYAGWSYEREWRLKAELKDSVDKLFYKDFDDRLHLREVILGPKCSLRPAEVASAVSNPPLDVEIFKARAAFSRFEVCRQEQVLTLSTKGWRESVKRLRDVYAHELPVEDVFDDESNG